MKMPTEMFMDSPIRSPAENIAVSATIAMLLEAAAYPKPGNVHRLKDFKETSFEHFLASATSVQSVYFKSAGGLNGTKPPAFGPLFYEAVKKSQTRQSGGNTHFGTFILLIPMTAAAGVLPETVGPEALLLKAADICRQTTPEDAVCFYKAFGQLGVPVTKTENGTEAAYDLTDPAAIEKIRRDGTTLYDLMAMGAARDMVAAEWKNGFEKSLLFSKKLWQNRDRFLKHPKIRYGSVLNSAVVFTFMELLAAYPDTFISTKHNDKTAAAVQKEAAKILYKKNGKKRKNLKKMIPKIKKLDRRLRKKKLNPGSTADITAAGLFIALHNGMPI